MMNGDDQTMTGPESAQGMQSAPENPRDEAVEASLTETAGNSPQGDGSTEPAPQVSASADQAPAPAAAEPQAGPDATDAAGSETGNSPAASESMTTTGAAATDQSSSEAAVVVAATQEAASGEAAIAGEASPAGTADDAAAPKRRVQLNPTVNDARAVPTYGGETVSPPAGGESTGSVVVEASAYLQAPPSGPVDVPKDAPLEADLEAELAAAMAGTMSQPTTSAAGAPDTALGDVPASEDQLEPGVKLKAKVQKVSSEDVFCDIGYRVSGLLPLKQFPQGKHPREGEEFLVVVDKYDAENGVVHVSLPKATRRPRGNWEELAVGQVVECVVNKTNKGGLEVTVSNLRAFLPASQVDLGFVSSMDSYVGQRFPVQITEVNPAKRNLVVSRRALLIQERKEAAAVFWEQVDVGQQYTGAVKTIKDYGAFVDLGGVDGFLHVGEMSWTRIKHPSDLLQEGQSIDVVVLSLDREKHKIGLGMRQLAQNPWNTAVDKYAVGTTVSGRVTRTTDFGAFVELEPGVEGLIHISELDHRRVKRVTEVLSVGQDVQAQVLEVNPERQRISLSLKSLKPKPEEPKDEDLSPSKGQAYERKRKEPLRGGTGAGSGGGLFGNPSDFGR